MLQISLARGRVPGVHMAVSGAIRRQLHRESAVHEEASLFRLVVIRRDVGADFIRGRVDEARARRVGHGVPAFGAGGTGQKDLVFTEFGFVAAGESTVVR